MDVEIDADWRGNIFCIRERTKELFNRKLWTDVSFVIRDESGQDHIIKAHKVILANASEVFEKMFYGSMPEDTSRDVPIEDITPETFSAMLKYIYTDEVDADSWDSVAELFCVAKKYMLHALAQHCVDCLINLLTASNALKIHEFATFHEIQKLLDAALKVFISQTDAVIKSPCFRDMKLSTLQTIVEQETLNIKEIELFNAVDSLAKQKGVIQGSRKNTIYNYAELQKSATWKEFRKIVHQIRFLSMADDIFIDGPGYSDLLLPEEAFSIAVCLTNSKKIESDYPEGFVQEKRKSLLPRVFFDISENNSFIGRIVFELRSDIVPKASEHFRSLCAGEKNIGYKNAEIFISSNIFLGYAIGFPTGRKLDDDFCDHESFNLKNTKAGIIGFLKAKTGKKSCRNTFYVSFDSLPDFDNETVAFGEVVEGLTVLQKLKSFVNSNAVRITNCGEV